ncbi:MAG TPA: hypothetical protein VHT30_10135 [Acidimicrobiales bacterium]|jgi:hypothetical protein|nr:hypothetical protein [Acidimicrobiales bacterium]
MPKRAPPPPPPVRLTKLPPTDPGLKPNPTKVGLSPKELKAKAKAAEKERIAQEKEIEKQRKAKAKQDEKDRLAKSKEANKRQKALYEGAKQGSTDVNTIAAQFQATMLKETAARQEHQRNYDAIIAEGRKKGFSPLRTKQAADSQLGDIEKIAEKLWEDAGPDVRAMRPLRFDPFDKRIRDIEAAKTDAMAIQHGLVSTKLMEDESTGGLMTVEKAGKKVVEHREEARLAKRMDKTATREEDPEASWERAKNAKIEKKTAKKKQELIDTGKVTQTNQLGEVVLEDHQVEAIEGKAQKVLEDKRDKDWESAGSGAGAGGTGIKLAGTGTKSGAKYWGDEGPKGSSGTDYQPSNPGEIASTDDAIVSGFSLGWLGDILSMVGGLIDFVQNIQHAKQYGATGQEKIAIAKSSADQLTNMATSARDACQGASFIIEKFQEHVLGSVVDTAGPLGAETIPGIGLAISALALISATIGSLPQMQRLGAQLVATEIQEQSPTPDVVSLLAMARVKKSVVVQIEQSFFNMAKNSTMIGLHIAELASAGGFGIPMAAKLSVTLVGLLHSAAHKARELIEEQLSAKAKARYFGAHEEGAAKGMIERDPGTAVDVVIFSAQKQKDFGSRIIISSYDIRDDDIDHMLHHEIRDKMLEGMEEEGDPKTIQEKWDDLKESAATFIEGDESTGEQSLKQALTPKTKAEKAREILDLEVLAKAKNASNYKGRNDRTVGIVDSMRSADKIDKSFLKVRQHMLRKDPSLTADKLPWSGRDDETRARRQRAKDEMQIPPGVRRNAEVASYVGLTNMIRQAKLASGPDAAIQLAYLERKAAEKKRAEELEKEKEDLEFVKSGKKKAKK